MSEKTDYKKFRAAVHKNGDRIERIENLLVVGMPDVNCCIAGTEFWLEIKSPKEPKRLSTPLFGSNHKLSQEQKNWFLSQKNAGGLGYILICTDQRWILIDGCLYADLINEKTVDELCELATYWFYTKNGIVKKEVASEMINYIVCRS